MAIDQGGNDVLIGPAPDDGTDATDQTFTEKAHAPAIAWVGALSLLAVGFVAAFFFPPVIGGLFLALGIVAVFVVTIVEVFKSTTGPVDHAARAAWAIWAAIRQVVQGHPVDALTTLALASFLDWFWLLVLVAVAFWLVMKRLKSKRKKR